MKARLELEETGIRILGLKRTEIYLELRIMGPALDALGFVMNLNTRTLGTDTRNILFNPNHLINLYLNDPRRLTREYMHLLIHCLLRHPFAAADAGDRQLFDLCADIAVEALIDTIDEPILLAVPSEFRETTIRKLKEEVQVLTAQRLYRYFTENKPDYDMFSRLSAEFARDDHQFWDTPDEDPPDSSMPNPRSFREQQWKDRADQTKQMAAVSGNEASEEKGSLSWMLSFENGPGTDYRKFLRRFMTVREEAVTDPDGFDYGYYNYGIELFGNLPLIEENEFRETVAVDQLVIVIDTSASTRQGALRQFLSETAAVLSAAETFFHHVHIHLIECDDQVQNDMLITDVGELKKYAEEYTVHGGMGTDFRPAFAYVDSLVRSGKLAGLKGLMYFTDGYGEYPQEAPSYDAAFVFCTDTDYDDTKVPGWAIKLYTDSKSEITGKQA